MGGAAPRPSGWVRILTVRSVVLVLAGLTGFVLITPTALPFMSQQTANEELRAKLAATRAENEEMQNELGRWQDDRYVIAQARGRLTFVFPGETPYRVLDPESAVEVIDPESGKDVADGPVTQGLDADQTWYTTVWDSVQIAGNAPR